MNKGCTPLAQLAAKLQEAYGEPGPGYRKMQMMAADGLLPVVRVNNRLYVEDDRLPEVAELLGVKAGDAA